MANFGFSIAVLSTTAKKNMLNNVTFMVDISGDSNMAISIQKNVNTKEIHLVYAYFSNFVYLVKIIILKNIHRIDVFLLYLFSFDIDKEKLIFCGFKNH